MHHFSYIHEKVEKGKLESESDCRKNPEGSTESDHFREQTVNPPTLSESCCPEESVITVRNNTVLFPDLLHPHFLIACGMQKQRENARGILSCDPWHG